MALKADKHVLSRLVWWMRERQSIYRKKEAGKPKPWTKDPVMQTYKFCNVFRELDRFTLWLAGNWRNNTAYHQHPNLPLAICLARYIGVPETLQELGFPTTWNPARLAQTLQDRKDRGEVVYTSAYRVASPHGGGPMAPHVARVLDAVAKARNSWVKPTLAETYWALREFECFGPFMAYEVVTDLRHTSYLRHAPDIMTWCSVGPGSTRGLNRIFGRPLERRLSQDEGLAEVLWLLPVLRRRLANADEMFEKLEPRDVEHSLCELDKHMRTTSGEGKPRQNYEGV